MAGGIKEKEKHERGSWSDLPLDIINLIVSRIDYVYQIRFQAVCKNWRAANIQYRGKFPWLMGYNSHSCYLYDPCDKQKYTVFNSDRNRREFFGARPLDSKHDWVLFEGKKKVISRRRKGSSLFFYSPFTDQIVNLPVLRKYGNGIYKATFSTTPVSRDCVIFAISYGKRGRVSICRSGDRTWTHFWVPGDCGCVKNVVYVDGFLYCSFFLLEVIGAFNVASRNWDELPYPPSIRFVNTHLIEYDGNLLIFGEDFNSSGYRVFKLNWSEMNWFEIESLDDRALFMDDSCLSVPVEKGSAFANTIHWFGGLSNFGYLRSEFIRKPVESDSSEDAPGVRDYEDWADNDLISVWIQPHVRRSINLN